MYKAILAGLAAVPLLTMLGCESKLQAPQSSRRDLWIGIYADSDDTTKCDIDSPSHNLSYKRQDQLRWYSVDRKKYQVVFEKSPPNPSPGTPFLDSHQQPRFTFDVPKTAAGVKSGEPVPGARGQYFAYGIKDQNDSVCKDAKSADPGVNIKP